MRRLVAALLTFLFIGCSTVEVNVDYDQKFDFLSVSNFSIEHKSKEGESSLVNDRIVNAITEQLKLKGYKNTTTPNGLIFHFYYSAKEKTDYRTSYGLASSFGRIGWGGGVMVSTTDTYNYTEGTLVIDARNPKTDKIVWRGIGVLELKEQKTPQEKTAYVNKIVAKILEKYPSKTLKE